MHCLNGNIAIRVLMATFCAVMLSVVCLLSLGDGWPSCLPVTQSQWCELLTVCVFSRIWKNVTWCNPARIKRRRRLVLIARIVGQERLKRSRKRPSCSCLRHCVPAIMIRYPTKDSKRPRVSLCWFLRGKRRLRGSGKRKIPGCSKTKHGRVNPAFTEQPKKVSEHSFQIQRKEMETIAAMPAEVRSVSMNRRDRMMHGQRHRQEEKRRKKLSVRFAKNCDSWRTTAKSSEVHPLKKGRKSVITDDEIERSFRSQLRALRNATILEEIVMRENPEEEIVSWGIGYPIFLDKLGRAWHFSPREDPENIWNPLMLGTNSGCKNNVLTPRSSAQEPLKSMTH